MKLALLLAVLFSQCAFAQSYPVITQQCASAMPWDDQLREMCMVQGHPVPVEVWNKARTKEGLNLLFKEKCWR
jgi:hypothetical protein